jgi:hypothetical protein
MSQQQQTAYPYRFAVNLYLTYHCNFRCAHCCHDAGPKNNQFMTSTQFEWVMRFLFRARAMGHQIRVIGLSGGEPMLHPDFYSISKTLRYWFSAIPLELHTNGSIKFEPPDFFPEKCFSLIRISTDQFHQRFRKFSTLETESLLSATSNLHVSNAGEFIRDKGRASYLGQPGSIQCNYVSMPHRVINFTPTGIRFCMDCSRPEDNPANFVSYEEYIREPLNLLDKCEWHAILNTGPNCASPCRFIDMRKESFHG